MASYLLGQDENNDWQPLAIDARDRALNTLDFAHTQIHRGKKVFYPLYSASLASGSSIGVLLKTASSVENHCTFFLSSSLGAILELFESVTVTDPGAAADSAIIVHNRYLQSSYVPTISCFTGSTLGTLPATPILRILGVGGNKVGVPVRAEDELMLLSNTYYYLRITSRAAGCEVYGHIDWYDVSH